MEQKRSLEDVPRPILQASLSSPVVSHLLRKWENGEGGSLIDTLAEITKVLERQNKEIAKDCRVECPEDNVMECLTAAVMQALNTNQVLKPLIDRQAARMLGVEVDFTLRIVEGLQITGEEES